MFDVGFWEIGLIAIVALLVVGPERMPGMIRTAGQWAGRVQRLARELRSELEHEATMQEYRKLNEEFREEDRRLKGLAAPTPPTPTEPPPPAKASTEPDDA